MLVKALEEMTRQQYKNAPAEASEKEQCAPAGASKEERCEVPAVEKSSNSQKRADALTAITEHFIATATVDDGNGGAQALAGHERVQVVLHMSVDSLKAEHEHGEHCNCSNHRMENQWISSANAKKFSSDASLYAVMEDKYGNVLNVGRKTRTVGTALKRALDLRDCTCRFPGCCANKYVDFHHILYWVSRYKKRMLGAFSTCEVESMDGDRTHYMEVGYV